MASITWKASPTNGVISLNTNWTGDVAPGVGDDAFIITSSTNPTSGSLSVASLTLSSGTGTNGTWTISGNMTGVRGSIISGGTYTIGGNLAHDGGIADNSNPTFNVTGTISLTYYAYSGTFWGAAGADTLVTMGTGTLCGGVTVNGQLKCVSDCTMRGIIAGAIVATKGVSFDNGATWFMPLATIVAAGNVRYGTPRYYSDTGLGTMPSKKHKGALR